MPFDWGSLTPRPLRAARSIRRTPSRPRSPRSHALRCRRSSARLRKATRSPTAIASSWSRNTRSSSSGRTSTNPRWNGSARSGPEFRKASAAQPCRKIVSFDPQRFSSMSTPTSVTTNDPFLRRAAFKILRRSSSLAKASSDRKNPKSISTRAFTRTASSTRPFTGNEASNSRPDLIGRGIAARTAVATINPTTRELQVVAGLYTSEERGSGISEERLVHNYLVEAGLAARIPKGIRIWEETLRDGEQTPGVAYTPEEKVRIARVLDEVHVPMMDVGIPVVSSEEARGVRLIANAGLDATIMAAARTVRKDVEACIACDVDEIALFTAGSDLHIKHKLAMTRDQVKAAAVRETEYAVSHGVDVSFVTEDTFRADLDFVVDLYDACTAAGAHRAVGCDTVGVMTPPGITWFFGQLKRRLKPTELSFHGHNDFRLAVANSLAAGEAGVAVPHTCGNGLGERSRNASFEELVLSLGGLFGDSTGIGSSRIYELARLGG